MIALDRTTCLTACTCLPHNEGSNDPDTYKLLWSSAVSTTPTVKWGTVSGVYTNVVTATTSRITKAQMCGIPANSTGYRDLGLIHQALLSGRKKLSAESYYFLHDSCSCETEESKSLTTLFFSSSGMVALSSTKIYYIMGDSKTTDFSKEYVFNVPPAKVRVM